MKQNKEQSRKRDHETEDDEVRKRIANLSSMMEGVEEKEGNDVEEDENVQDSVDEKEKVIDNPKKAHRYNRYKKKFKNNGNKKQGNNK